MEISVVSIGFVFADNKYNCKLALDFFLDFLSLEDLHELLGKGIL